ncbi:phosphopantothenoylcysteine decarboxylase, partial [Propionibacterium freudenreichii]|nr:phosphopantothenoylcysteine decarboxylase [Propionibacterium freudenreichii]
MTSASSTHSRERHILLGVTGSIAAFKAAQLASDWVKQGHQVRVLMTAAAAQFVSPLTFQSLTHQSVRIAMFDDSGASQTATDDGMHVGITHIDDAKWADVFVIAPASADVIARIAAGMANDHLTATLLAATCPVVLAPAMNTRMYDNPVTQRNMTTCRQLGMSFVEPSSGLLACEDVGKGRLAELSDIEWAVDEALEGMSAPRFDADVAGPGRSGA